MIRELVLLLVIFHIYNVKKCEPALVELLRGLEVD